MILGCSKSDLAYLKLEAPLTVDVSEQRCPAIDKRALAEFQSAPAAPAGAVTKRDDQAWHDANEEAIRRKNRIGQRLVREYERCRAGSGNSPAATALKALTTS